MVRVTLTLLMGLLLMVGLVGCTETSPEEEDEKIFSSVTDDEGVEVILEESPENIVSLMPSKTEKIFALGRGDNLVGVSDYCNYPPELEETDVKSMGDAFEVSEEAVIAQETDLVVANSLPDGMRETLEGQDIPVFVTNPQDVEGTVQSLELLGELLGE